MYSFSSNELKTFRTIILEIRISSTREKSERDKARNSLLLTVNKPMVPRAGGQWEEAGHGMGVKEGTCCDERRMMYGSAESL